MLNPLFQLNRRVMKAYLLKESLDRLWTTAMKERCSAISEVDRATAVAAAELVSETGPDAAEPPRRNPELLPDQGAFRSRRSRQRQHPMLINRGRGYKNMRYLLLKAKRMAATNTEYVAFQKKRKAA